jgi:hypothetical protein
MGGGVEGYGRLRPGFERLLDALEVMNLIEVDAVAAAWHQVRRYEREAAWTAVRRLCRATASDDALDAAFRARRAASQMARLAGAHDPGFQGAAWDAGLALASPYELDDRYHLPLVTPMARALPWLLRDSEMPPGRGRARAARGWPAPRAAAAVTPGRRRPQGSGLQ